MKHHPKQTTDIEKEGEFDEEDDNHIHSIEGEINDFFDDNEDCKVYEDGNENEDENDKQNISIEEWIDTIFTNDSDATKEKKEKLRETLSSKFSAHYVNDLIRLQSEFDHIVIYDICSSAEFDQKSSIKFSMELFKLNNNSNNNHVGNYNQNDCNENDIETSLAILNHDERQEYLRLQAKMDEFKKKINDIETRIENKDKTSRKLLNELIKEINYKNEEYYSDMQQCLEINKENLAKLSCLNKEMMTSKLEDKDFNIIDEINCAIENYSLANQPINILKPIYAILRSGNLNALLNKNIVNRDDASDTESNVENPNNQIVETGCACIVTPYFQNSQENMNRDILEASIVSMATAGFNYDDNSE